MIAIESQPVTEENMNFPKTSKKVDFVQQRYESEIDNAERNDGTEHDKHIEDAPNKKSGRGTFFDNKLEGLSNVTEEQVDYCLKILPMVTSYLKKSTLVMDKGNSSIKGGFDEVSQTALIYMLDAFGKGKIRPTATDAEKYSFLRLVAKNGALNEARTFNRHYGTIKTNEDGEKVWVSRLVDTESNANSDDSDESDNLLEAYQSNSLSEELNCETAIAVDEFLNRIPPLDSEILMLKKIGFNGTEIAKKLNMDQPKVSKMILGYKEEFKNLLKK